MSQNENNIEVITDSQETHYDPSQIINNTQVLNESQDFALVVGEDSDESTKNQTQVQDMYTAENVAEKILVEPETQFFDERLTTQVDEANQEQIAESLKTKNEEILEGLKNDNNSDDENLKEKKGSDEDEIIQGTPPEISSPSRKLLSGKRKRESLDEPPAKIQRTLSDTDALQVDKESQENTKIDKQCIGSKLLLSNLPVREMETQSSIFCENTEYFESNVGIDTPVNRNMIIAETEEIENSQPILFDNPSEDDNGETENNTKESEYKNELSSDPGDSRTDTTSIKADHITKGDSNLSQKMLSQTIDKIVAETKTNGKHTGATVDNDKSDQNIDTAEPDRLGKKIESDAELAKRNEDNPPKADTEFFNVPLPSSDSASDSNCEVGSHSSNKSRQSIEVIYQGKSSTQDKKKFQELVEIDEEGEKIVLDSSNTEGEKIILDSSNEEYQLRFSTGSSNNSPQNISAYKSCAETKSTTESSYKSIEWNDAQENNEAMQTSDHQITNGEEDFSTSGTTKTISERSDMLSDDIAADTMHIPASKPTTNDSDLNDRSNLKMNETMELANLVSDSKGDSMHVNEIVENKSEDTVHISSNVSTASKTTVYEKRTRFYVDLKYLVHVDDNTKEIVYKEVTDVHCEPIVEHSGSRRISDASGCLADLSGNANKDTSPGSVLSNPQFFQLPGSRFSITSTISSSSSVSSAASLAMKLFKDVHFSQPKGRAKHARRPAMDAVSEEKSLMEISEKITQGWKNGQFITDAILQSVNMVVSSPDNFHHDNEPSKSEDQVLSFTQEPGASEDKVLSSTPEPIQEEKVTSQVATPKSTKEKKSMKRTRTKPSKSTRSNGLRKVSPEVVSTSQEDRIPLSKRKRESINTIQLDKLSNTTSNVSTPSRVKPETPKKEALRSLTPQNLLTDELVGKIVFAKWSDNNYYPGEVVDNIRGKFKVKFYDGKSKLLIEEFVIPIPESLSEGLSVYATTKEHGYGTMAIILQSENVNNVIYYSVSMDNGKVVKVQIKDIFLTPDQARILKEQIDLDSTSFPKTPQHLGQVSLYNCVDGKRRSRHPSTPVNSTPKSRKGISPKASKINESVSASGSGIPKVKGKEPEISSSESENKVSDSNMSSIEDVDGVQPELVAIPAAQISKGPSNRMKGRGRSKSKQTQDDKELGPILPISSTIFRNMSFILTCTSPDIISRRKIDDSCSEAGTENEEEWLRTPFVRDRIKNQLINGGGTVYDSFRLIPPTEYKNTRLITNAPNLTAKSIQCLSVGIPVYSHNWVIQCCKENKLLSPSSYELPAGLSLGKNDYIESCNRRNKQPFTGMIIGMPMLNNRNEVNRSIQFWRQICENAGAGVQIIDNPETEFCHVTAILTDNRCPSSIVEKADNWQIPLVSTVWIVQCIIAGELLIHDSHPQYKHTFIQS